MPHDANGHIYVDRTDPQHPIGIDPSDVAYVLGRRSRDYGHLCGDTDDPMDGGTVDRGGKVNPLAAYKPYRSAGLATTEEERFAANYGWDILKKPAYSSLSNLLPTIDSREDAGTPIWGHLPPRGFGNGPGGTNEWARILDYDKYYHGEQGLGRPRYVNRLTTRSIPNIQDTDFVVPLNAQDYSRSVDSAAFELRDAFEIQFNIDITNPASASNNIRLYFEVDVYVSIYDSNNRAVFQEHVEISADGINQHPKKHIRIGDYLSGSGYYHIHYDFQCRFNQSEYVATGERIPVTFTVSIPSSYTMQLSNTGVDGIILNKFSHASDWGLYESYQYSPALAVFGNYANQAYIQPILAVKVSNGSTSQIKLCLPGDAIIFERIGITIKPRASASEDDIVVYVFYGDYERIFPDYQDGIDYCDITAGLVSQNELTCAPHCRLKYGILAPQPGPMVVHQDDCQGAIFSYKNGTSESNLYPHGVHGSSNEGFTDNTYALSRIQIDWGFYIEDLPGSMPFVVHLDVYYDDEIVASDTKTYTATPNSSYYWGVTAQLETSGVDGWSPNELEAKIWIEVDEDIYYLDIGRQLLTQTDPGYYRLGWD